MSNRYWLHAINADVQFCYAYLVHGATMSILDMQTLHFTFPLSESDLECSLRHYITCRDPKNRR